MHHLPTQHARSVRLVTLSLALLLIFSACERQESYDDDSLEVEEPTTATTAATSSLAETDTVNVLLTDAVIDVPATLSAGTTLFVVTNAGEQEHNFELAGQTFEENLQPGATDTLEIDLESGTYEASCPVHAEQGVSVEVDVTADSQPN